MNNNINLLKVVRPSPARKDGQLIGFRVRPGTVPALFQQTGLRNGDIVTAINGMPLNSNNASRQAMQNLATSSGATLTVERAGQQTTVQISF
ncbi:MAG: PDZ domain-containing protein [Thiolinea sp.]